MSRHIDPAVQQVIDLLERSRPPRSSPGSGWFADAMRGLLDVLLADARGVGPSREELERLWDAVHRVAVEHRGNLRSFSWHAEIEALSALNDGWEPASWRRSVLELLRVDPRLAGLEPLSDDDMAEIDDELREAAEDVEPLPAHLIPDGVPASHWWWWAPSAHYSD